MLKKWMQDQDQSQFAELTERDFANNKNSMILVDGHLDADTLFDTLERTAAKTDCIVVENGLNDYKTEQVISCFLNRYKMFLEYVHAERVSGPKTELNEMPPPRGCEGIWRIYIKLERTVDSLDGSGYEALADAYTESYYLTDCGGYDDFRKSHGMEITPRLKNIYSLVDPRQGERILDIGCGRGELAFAFAAAGAEVEGVDYSKDAIAIARRTFGDKCKGLRYIYADILKMDRLDSFDKIVMADVVEHIEQELLEKIFEKISLSLNSSGCLIIHTAPNKDYYEITYPKIREQAARLGYWKPRNPRSYYEQLMHINEQTPVGLKKALQKYFQYVRVWTGWFEEIDSEKMPEESCKDMEIFAIASQESGQIERRIKKYTKKPELAGYQVQIKLGDITMPKGETNCIVPVTMKNLGSETISSMRKYPINLAYHILDHKGKMVVWDGERTPIIDEIQPGTQRDMRMQIKIPVDLVPNETYICRITLVAEGCFWFDQEGGNKTDVFLRIK